MLGFKFAESPETVAKTLLETLSNGGPDDHYTLSKTWNGTLGFVDLRPYQPPNQVQFLGFVKSFVLMLDYPAISLISIIINMNK